MNAMTYTWAQNVGTPTGESIFCKNVRKNYQSGVLLLFEMK